MSKTLKEIANSKYELQEKINRLLEEYLEDNPEVKLTNVNITINESYNCDYKELTSVYTEIILVVK